MFCTMCGKELPEGANFCPHCRAEVVKIVPREEAAEAPDMPGEEAGKDVPVEAAGEAAVEAAASVPEESAASEETSESADEPEPTEPANEPEPAPAPSETTILSEQSDEPAAETAVLSESEPSEPDAAAAERAEAAADAAAAEQALWTAPTDAAEPSGVAPTTVMEPAHLSSQDMQNPAGQGAPGQPRKKLPAAIIATIALLVIAGAAFFCIFVLPRITGGNVQTATYGQADPVQCSVITRVRPRDESGADLTSYVAMLVRRVTDSAMNDDPTIDEQLGEIVSEIRVTGNNGFTMESFGDVPDGDYVLVIVPTDADSDESGEGASSDNGHSGTSSSGNSSSDEQRIPIHLEEDNPDAEEEVVVTPPAPNRAPSQSTADTTEEPEGEELTDEQIASALFYYVCQDLIEEYGEPTTVERFDGIEIDADGLALAELIDFNGDGVDELLTVVCTADLTDDFRTYLPEDYKIAVWAYEDGEVSQIYDGNAPYTNGGYYFVDLYVYAAEEAGPVVIYAMDYSYDEDTDAATTESTYYVMNGNAFEPLARSVAIENYEEASVDFEYYLFEEACPENEWSDFVAALTHKAQYWCCLSAEGFTADREDEPELELVEPGDFPKRTTSTIDALKEAAGDEALEAFAPKESTGAEAEDDPAEAAYTYANNEADVTFTTSQGEGTDWEETRSWTYPQFTLEDGSSTEALDALNAAFRQSYEDDLTGAQSWNFESGDVQVWEHRDEVTYLEGDIASVLSYRTIFLGGAHPSEAASGACYDLSTGEEVSASEAFGISQDDLQTAAEDAIVAYIDSHANMSGADDASIQGMAADMTRYYATEDGIAIIVMPNEIASNAEGIQYIYVHAFDDPSLVGTSAAA